MLGISFTSLKPPVDIPVISERGVLSPEWRQFWASFYHVFQNVQVASILPPLSQDQIDSLTGAQDGWMVYNTTIPSPQVKIAGVWTNFP